MKGDAINGRHLDVRINNPTAVTVELTAKHAHAIAEVLKKLDPHLEAHLTLEDAAELREFRQQAERAVLLQQQIYAKLFRGEQL